MIAVALLVLLLAINIGHLRLIRSVCESRDNSLWGHPPRHDTVQTPKFVRHIAVSSISLELLLLLQPIHVASTIDARGGIGATLLLLLSLLIPLLILSVIDVRGGIGKSISAGLLLLSLRLKAV